jgi:hypothetical protein
VGNVNRAVAAALVVGAAAARAEVDVWRWIPAETRVIVQYDPHARDQLRAREVLGVEALVARFATTTRLKPLDHMTVAYVPAAGGAQPVAFAHGAASLSPEFARLRGAALEPAGGHQVFGSRAADAAVTQLEAECVAEGPHRALNGVLVKTQSAAQSLSAHASESARRLLNGGQAAPVSLVYVAPPGGSDLFTVLQDLDRVFDADMSVALQSYQKPLQMLGVTHAVRLDLEQRGHELDTTVYLAMANRMAAQIASVSLDASRDMVRVAARGAVKSGGLSATDAKLLEEALASLETHADGDVVRVTVRVPDEPAQ